MTENPLENGPLPAIARSKTRPEDLLKLKEIHHRGVFGDFTIVINERIRELAAHKHPINIEKIKFFEYLLQRVDAVEFARVQAKFLDLAIHEPKVDLPKYIDPLIWFESKLSVAHLLGLHQKSPCKILDLGTGPGHFPFVAGFYGHDVLGTDLPNRTVGRGDNEHLYDALCDLYRVKRIGLAIQAGKKLEATGNGYSLVTALLAAFNVHKDKSIWREEDWNFFIRDVRDNVLLPDGALFMILANDKLDDEVWSYLVRHAKWHDVQKKHIYFDNLTFAGY